MHFSYEVKIPKSTSQAAPYVKDLQISAGFITGMQIIIPAGHAGTAHLVLKYHEFQVYPLSRDEDYHGDGVPLVWRDQFDLGSGPFELKAEGWNTDTHSDHRFQVHIEIMRAEQLGINTGTVTLKDLIGIVGTELEV